FTAALSADGKTAVTASFDASIRLWQLDPSEEVSQVVGHIGKLQPGTKSTSILTEDGEVLLALTGDDEGLYWNLVTGERLRRGLERHGLQEAKNRHLHMPVLDRGGRLFAFPRPDGVVSLWNFNDGEQTELRGQEGQMITALAVARDGRTVAAGNDAGQVVAWNLPGGDAEPRVLATGRVSRGAALSPDGQRLAIALQDRLELLDVASGAVLATAELDPARTLAAQHRFLDFSPNGKLLVARDKASSALLLWNLGTRQLDRIELGGHGVQWLAFSPDSSRLALAVEDRTVRVVDTATRQIRLLGMHRDLVHMVAWSPDGKMLASASYDRTIRLWDPDTGRVRVLRGHSRSVESIAFEPDGVTLISASADETVRKWFIKRLPDNRAEAVNKRLVTATTAVIGVAERQEKRTAARPATPAPDR
ncbi:MAG TPA: WD40 repeat domain-containing protein, partial [Kofleriaceae bacterium]|nr:WD40 repeat domain-containing protein [Kofleriaceae bacterium]